jgi:hypothetical protein
MTHRLTAVVCVALVVFVTVAPVASGHLSDVLLPLSLALFPVLAMVVLRRRDERVDEQSVSRLSLLAPRAPPVSLVVG